MASDPLLLGALKLFVADKYPQFEVNVRGDAAPSHNYWCVSTMVFKRDSDLYYTAVVVDLVHSIVYAYTHVSVGLTWHEPFTHSSLFQQIERALNEYQQCL